MADNGNKRYYWLKLSEDFFRQKEIKQLRRIAGGDTFTIIYLKMLLRSLEDSGKLYYEGIESDFVSELALDIDEDEENVKMTVAFLVSKGILVQSDSDEYKLTTAGEMTGSEGASARRMRRLRNRNDQKLLSHSDGAVTARDTEIDIDIDTDTEKEPDTDKKDDDEKAGACAEAYKPYGGDRTGETAQKYAMDNLRVMTPGHMQEFNEFMDEHGISEDVMKYAIDVACGNGAAVWNYVAQVLYGWLDAGVKTVGEAKAEQAKRKKKRDVPKQSRGSIDRENNKVPLPYGGGIIV